jgi:hypothetical protein
MIVIKVKGHKNVREGSGPVIRIGASGFERNIDGSATLPGRTLGIPLYVLFLDGSVALTPRSWMGENLSLSSNQARRFSCTSTVTLTLSSRIYFVSFLFELPFIVEHRETKK